MPLETTRYDIDPEQAERSALREAGLRYVSCNDKGYSRITQGKDVVYIDQNGRSITNERILARIRSLVLPPAWTNVWICASPNGHLQATGLDTKGRKQYKYHPKWASLRSEKKFATLLDFGKQLPQLQKKIERDLRKKRWDRDKVCALALAIMDKTSFRSGNRSYEKENGSFGLTTLRNKHAKPVSAHKIFFKFVGKKGVLQQTYLAEKKLVNMLLKVREIPGQRLFQYYDGYGEVRQLESGDLNMYLKDAMCLDVTCKSFRTWNGCVLALAHLTMLPLAVNQVQRKKNTLAVIDRVAEALGNTRAVTRSHYIHPALLTAYEEGRLDRWIRDCNRKETPPTTERLKKRLFSLLSQ
ncbi:DNA topoisomerase IB [Sphingobacterium suaedae]|uniref:DNA topoisomerase n=1 Tax=Sphingobacterium suaedae TaxID=1686402 RepID=A0ABW5KPD8_9SPHI